MTGPDARTSLNAARRERELAALPDEVVDVLVVGLGATGAGAALEAASRGCRSPRSTRTTWRSARPGGARS